MKSLLPKSGLRRASASTEGAAGIVTARSIRVTPYPATNQSGRSRARLVVSGSHQ